MESCETLSAIKAVVKEETDFEASNSPTTEEIDDNVQYIIVDPRTLSDDECGSSKKRVHWEHWETKTLIDILKEYSDKSKGSLKENFFIVEQEMRRRGVERWDGNQMQHRWHNLRKEWLNARTSNYRNGTSKSVSEFHDELEELLGTPPSNYSLSGIDTSSGEEIMGYEVETLEPNDHVAILLDNDEKNPRVPARGSPLCSSEQKRTQWKRPHVKPSSSEDGLDGDSAHEPVKEKKQKKKDTDTQSKKDLFIWPHEGVLLLLKQYKKMQHEFLMGKKRHSKIWDEIAKIICSMNTDFKVTGCQCQQKISGLKRTYSSIKENLSFPGNDKISWPYFRMVDKIFGDTAKGKLGFKRLRKGHVKQRISISSSSDEDLSGKTSAKRGRIDTILEQYIQDVKKQRELLRLKRERKAEEKEQRREEMERRKMEQRSKMHEEKMIMQKAALDILKQILSKNK